jgi:phosphate transport system permease protein
MKLLSRHIFIVLYALLTISLVLTFTGKLVFSRTTAGVFVGTLIATVGATIVATVPAYLLAGILAGVFRVPAWVERFALMICYVLAGMPSIILGVIGFIVFCHWLGFGWSLLSAILTLVLVLFPNLIAAFVQLLKPISGRYQELARSLSIGPLEFMFRSVPRYKAAEMGELLIFGWTRALGDTAAVMLTCGTLLDMPKSVFDSVRLLNYHIYLLAMEVPGGMREARSLSFLVIVGLFVLLFAPRLIFNLWTSARQRVPFNTEEVNA